MSYVCMGGWRWVGRWVGEPYLSHDLYDVPIKAAVVVFGRLANHLRGGGGGQEGM